MKRHICALEAAVFITLSSLLGGQVDAHTVNFTIWAWNYDIWAGTQNHFHNQYEYPYQPWDFNIPIDTQVRQEASGSFYWQAFHTGPGNEFNGNLAWKWDLWVWNQNGAQLYSSAAFECDRVTWDGTLFPYPRVYNSMQVGTYEQWSGAGAFCIDSYISKDFYQVSSNP
jgi:hypothetical protein